MSWLRTAGLCAVALGAFGMVALGGGLLVGSPTADDAGSALVGSFYGEMVQVALENPANLLPKLVYGLLHLAGVLALFAPCVAFLLAAIVATPPDEDDDLLRFLGLFLLSLMGIVAGVIALLVSQEMTRLHLRYVSFAFPPLLALAFVWARRRPEIDTFGFRLGLSAAWIAGASVLALQLPSLRLLPVDSPELFFAYTGPEFGAFGLGGAARWIAPAVIVCLSGLVLAGRMRWLDAQFVALVVFLPIAGANTVVWQGRWSAGQEALRRPGEVARLLCDSGEGAIVAASTPQDFPVLYPAMAAIDRIVPLTLLPSEQLAGYAAKLPAGACLLSTLPANRQASGQVVVSTGAVTLLRAGAPPLSDMRPARAAADARP